MSKKKKENRMGKLINYYEVIDKDLLPKSHNPGYDKHHISLPARILIVGATGSGKTNAVVNLLGLMKNTFEEIIVLCLNKDEPLYNHLARKIGGDQLRFIEIENFKDIPSPKAIGEDKKQRLVLFDDLCLLPKKELKLITTFFTTGRKYHMTMCFLTQAYFEAPKTLRSQCNYIFLVKISSDNDLKLILRDHKLDMKLEELLMYYKYATREDMNFLMIDKQTNDPDKKFRKNFDEII